MSLITPITPLSEPSPAPGHKHGALTKEQRCDARLPPLSPAADHLWARSQVSGARHPAPRPPVGMKSGQRGWAPSSQMAPQHRRRPGQHLTHAAFSDVASDASSEGQIKPGSILRPNRVALGRDVPRPKRWSLHSGGPARPGPGS